MKAKIKYEVLDFMKEVNTCEMSSNEFIWRFLEYKTAIDNPVGITKELFTMMPSVESIVRSRRLVIADYGIGKRTKADTQAEYIEAYVRDDRYKS